LNAGIMPNSPLFCIRPIRKFYTPYVVLFSALSPDSYAISYVHGKIRLSDAK